MPNTSVIPAERIERAIYLIRGHKVMLDVDLAALYGVTTGNLNKAVARNVGRFPEDFMFRLTAEEFERLSFHSGISSTAPESGTSGLRSQSVISNARSESDAPGLRLQSATSKAGRGGRRYAPYAFTEQGVAMLSSVLRSPRAVAVNIEIMRAFVRLRQMLASNEELSRKLDALERKYDRQFKAVFDAIRALMTPPAQPRRPIGFRKPVQ